MTAPTPLHPLHAAQADANAATARLWTHLRGRADLLGLSLLLDAQRAQQRLYDACALEAFLNGVAGRDRGIGVGEARGMFADALNETGRRA